MRVNYFECSCSTAEHVIRLSYLPNDYWCFLEVYLNDHNSFIKRLVAALKHVFKVQSHCFCDTVLSVTTATKMKEALEGFIKANDRTSS